MVSDIKKYETKNKDKKMKKYIVLILTFLLAITSIVFAVEEGTEYIDRDPVEISDKLYDYGAIKGNEDGDLMIDYYLNREDAVVILCRMMGKYEEALEFKGDPTFLDIKNPYYAPIIGFAKNAGWIKGRSKTDFGFGDRIKAAEFAVMMLRALDYTPEYKTSFPNALELGILEGLKVEKKTEVVRGDAFIMIYNTLMLPKKDAKRPMAYDLGYEKEESNPPLAVKSVSIDNFKVVSIDFTSEVLEKSLQSVVIKRGNTEIGFENIILDGDGKSARFFLIKALNKGANVTVEVKKRELEEDEDEDDFEPYMLAVRNAENTEDCLEFEEKIIAQDDIAPQVLDIEFINAKMISVYASEPLDLYLGKGYNGLKINGSNRGAMLAGLRDNVYTFLLSTKLDAGINDIELDYIKDYAGNKLKNQNFSIEVEEDDTAPAIVSAKEITSKKIMLKFDEMLSNIGSFEVDDKEVMFAQFDEYDKSIVYLILDPRELKEKAVNGVKVSYKEQKDYAGNKVEDFVDFTFKARDDDTPPVARIAEIDEDTITIVFNKPMRFDLGWYSLKSGNRTFYLNKQINPYDWVSKDMSAIKLKLPIIKALKDTEFELTLERFRDMTVRHNKMEKSTFIFRSRD